MIVPLIVRRKAAELGAEGARWLAALPAVVAELERRWDTPIGPPLDGGTEAYVARAGRGGWCPQLLAEPGLTRRYCRLMADLSGLAEEAIWEWGYLERVSSGLYLLSLGADGGPFLRTAELLLAR